MKESLLHLQSTVMWKYRFGRGERSQDGRVNHERCLFVDSVSPAQTESVNVD